MKQTRHAKCTSQRGIYERIPGSGVWWIHYQHNGQRKREKAGRKSDAIALYQKRKADALIAGKLPQLRTQKLVTLSDLIDDALEFVADHKDVRNYKSKAAIVREALGTRPASELTPQEIERWIRSRCKTPATANRYKAFFSLCYREAINNGKLTVNPARQVRHKRESPGRLRFLSREEYTALCAEIKQRFPGHLPSFIVSVNTGMRLTEQFTVEWNQVSLQRRTIELTKTKNGTVRTVHLNPDALAAVESLKRKGQKASDRVFPNSYKNFETRDWFKPSLETAGITAYTWHGNRHTFCSWLAMAGATIKEIQELAGHKTITMSARYAHLSPSHKLLVVDRISSPSTTATRTATG